MASTMLVKRGISSYVHGGKYMKAEIVRKKGKNILADPIFNKGLGFPRCERDRLAIRGLLPSQARVYISNFGEILVKNSIFLSKFSPLNWNFVEI